MKKLRFYTTPFSLSPMKKYSLWVHDSKGNFVFEFEDFDASGKHIPGKQELYDSVLLSLNSNDHIPLNYLDLHINPSDTNEILNFGEVFIRIRGWGNLTGIGGYNLDDETASKIQDETREWILYKLKSE